MSAPFDPAGARQDVLIRQMQGQVGERGAVLVTWPGGSPRAANEVVPHGLGRVPEDVQATARTNAGSFGVFPVPATFAYTDESFSISAVTSDGSSPAAGQTALLGYNAV